MSIQINDIERLTNNCLIQNDFILSFESGINNVSISQIKKIKSDFFEVQNEIDKFDNLTFLPYLESQKLEGLKEIFASTKDKVDSFFKEKTLIINVNYDAGFGNNLYISGVSGDWKKGYKLEIKNTCNWFIRVPKPNENGCFEFKIIRYASTSEVPPEVLTWQTGETHEEWQPTDNYFILPCDQSITINIKGRFSDVNSYLFETDNVIQSPRLNENHNRIAPSPRNNSNQPQEDSENWMELLRNFSLNEPQNWQENQFENLPQNEINNSNDQEIPINSKLLPQSNNSNQPNDTIDVIPDTEIEGCAHYVVKQLVPTSIALKAKRIEELRDKFEKKYEDADSKDIPKYSRLFHCPLTQEIMTLPIFDVSHPDVKKQDQRHYMETSMFDQILSEGSHCPSCRIDISDQNLRIDMTLQDSILKFLEENTK